jgi:hypothetical protein
MGIAHPGHPGQQAGTRESVVVDLESLFRSLDIPRQTEGLTVREMSERMGRSKRWVRERAGELVRAGKCAVVQAQEVDMVGRLNVTYRYKFKEVAE